MEDSFTVYETGATIVTPCVDCDVPGYLIVQPRQSATLLTEVPLFAAELGETLSRLECAILSATGASHLYVLRFSEAQHTVHFHLFPRTDEMAATFAQATGRSPGQIVGPELFEWARLRFHTAGSGHLSQKTVDTAMAISDFMGKGSPIN